MRYRLASIVVVAVASLVGCTVDGESTPENTGRSQAAITQANAPWHLDRLDQSTLPLDTNYTFQYRGTGVTVYILSTWLRYTHNEIAGRALNVFPSSPVPDSVGTATQLAGIVGGTTFGVAKDITIRGVAVHGEDPATDADLVAGLDWVRLNATQPAVALVGMPIPNSASQSVKTALQSLVSSGVVVVLPIGENATSPTGISTGVFRVGATDVSDAAAWASAVGPVDIRAPGVNVKTAGHLSNGAQATVSGTIYSAAIVAGLTASYIQKVGIVPLGVLKQSILNLAVPIPSTSTDGAKLGQMAW